MSLATDRQSYVLVGFDQVELHPRNPRRADIPAIVESIRDLGWFGACGRQASSGLLIWGNGRYQAGRIARDLMARAADGEDVPDAEIWRAWPARFGGPLEQLPIFDLDVSDEEALLILLQDNAASDRADYDRPGLAELLDEIEAARGTLDGTGYSTAERDALIRGDAGPIDRDVSVSLAERFLVPPFSVLDARQGYWQDRKRAWLALGIRSEIGRPQNVLRGGEGGAMADPQYRMGMRPNGSKPSDSGNDPAFYWKKQAAERLLGRELSTAEFLEDHYDGVEGAALVAGTSIFDPVLAELAVRWYCPPDGRILDPFAGGSVRGIVASRLGRQYVGVDLSADQVAANRDQLDIAGESPPEWIVGDARDVRDLTGGPFDLLLTCPPYYDLERYSDDPADLSNAADWPAFCAAYEDCLAAGLSLLAAGSFAVLVVGNVRDRAGMICDLGAATVAACQAAGAALYNDAILVTALSSLPVRAGRIFGPSRKLGRTHQQVLVFVKPPVEDAIARLGELDLADLDQAVEE